MSIKVKFAASGVEATWIEGSILEFAEKHGVMPDFGCRGGSCGSCESRLLSGDVSYLEEACYEPEPGHVLLCCTRPAEGIDCLEIDV